MKIKINEVEYDASGVALVFNSFEELENQSSKIMAENGYAYLTQTEKRIAGPDGKPKYFAFLTSMEI